VHLAIPRFGGYCMQHNKRVKTGSTEPDQLDNNNASDDDDDDATKAPNSKNGDADTTTTTTTSTAATDTTPTTTTATVNGSKKDVKKLDALVKDIVPTDASNDGDGELKGEVTQYFDAVLRLNPAGRPEDNYLSVAHFMEKAAAGVTMIKHNKYGTTHKKTVTIDHDGVLSFGTGNVQLRNCIEVKPGKKGQGTGGVADLMFTIVLPDRALEFQLSSKEQRDEWIKGIRAVVARLASRKQLKPVSRAIAEPPMDDDFDFNSTSVGVRRASVDAVSTPMVQTAPDFLGARTQGSFIKHGRLGKPHVKVLRLDPKTGILDWGSGNLHLGEVTDIIPGKNTPLFAKVSLSVAHPRVCFSIVCPNRTLDLQAASEDERDTWVQGLEDLRAFLIKNRPRLSLSGNPSSTTSHQRPQLRAAGSKHADVAAAAAAAAATVTAANITLAVAGGSSTTTSSTSSSSSSSTATGSPSAGATTAKSEPIPLAT
jgi:cell division septation protein DedD